MKNLYFLFVFVLLRTGIAHAQYPPEGSVSIIGQAAVDAYIADYGNCSALTGNLYINDVDGTDLSFLHNLESVGGFVRITDCKNLTSLDGLQNLESVGGQLLLSIHPLLTNLDGLSALTSVRGEFSLYGLPLVANLEGLNALTSIGGLSVEMLPLITDLDGLSNLTSIISFVNVVNNESLSDCAISILCQKVSDDSVAVDIRGNAPGCAEVADLIAACNVSSEGCPPGDITILNDDDVATYNQLYSSCTALPGNLTVKNVSDLSFLSNVTTVAGRVRIEECLELTSLNGLQNLESAEGGLLLSVLMALPGLNELSNLKIVGTEGLVIAY